MTEAQQEVFYKFRADKKLLRPVFVACQRGGYPHCDADGEQVFENTHFDTEQEAWECIKDDVLARLSQAVRFHDRALAAIQKEREGVVLAATEVDRFFQNIARRENADA